jgi:hypothetical protein
MGVKEEDFDCLARDQGRFFCSMVILQKSTGRIWELINVYGLAQHEFSSDFLLELSEKLINCDLPVMIGGDFNLIRFSNEKSSGNGNVSLMNLCNSFIVDMGLVEVHRVGPFFTWSNKQSDPIREVLDRGLVSPSWELFYPLVIIYTLMICGFDHNPPLAPCAPRLPSHPREFRMESAWFLDPEFKVEVKKHWPVKYRGGILDYWHNQQVRLRHL